MAKWQGTVVPNSGYVDKIYLNTNLSIDEVVSCIENANLTYDEDGFSFILRGETPNKVICVINADGLIGIGDLVTQVNYFVNIDVGLGFVGWNPEFNGVINVEENLDVLPTTQNDKLIELFSITPFTQSQPTTVDKLQKLINGKQYVIDKTNAKAGTSLNIKSKWKDIGDVIEGIPSGGSALIKGDWKGTIVPNNGHIEKLYFNTNLSVDEVVAICKTLRFVPYPDGSYDIWACLTDETMANGIAIMRIAGMYYAIVHTIDGESNFLFSNFEEDDITIGWQDGVTGVIEFNMENQLSAVAPYLGFTPENDKAAELFSTTLFTQESTTLSGEYDGSTLTLTELPKDSGTVVPNTGYIEKVYFNTNLNVEATVEILSKLTYIQTPFLSYPLYPILFSSDGIPVVFAVKFNDYYEINISYDLQSQDNYERIFLSYNDGNYSSGFYKNECEINKTVINEYSGMPIGFENNLLSSLISITPFTQAIPSIDIKSMIENERKLPLKINFNLSQSSQPTDVPQMLGMQLTPMCVSLVDHDLTYKFDGIYTSETFSTDPEHFKLNEELTKMVKEFSTYLYFDTSTASVTDSSYYKFTEYDLSQELEFDYKGYISGQSQPSSDLVLVWYRTLYMPVELCKILQTGKYRIVKAKFTAITKPNGTATVYYTKPVNAISRGYPISFPMDNYVATEIGSTAVSQDDVFYTTLLFLD